MRREIPMAVVVIVLLAVIVLIGFLFYKGTQAPPPTEVNPLTGEPVKSGTTTPQKLPPEHGGR